MFALYRTSKNLPVRSLPFITALFLAAVVGLTALALAAPTQQAEARDASRSNHAIENVKGCSEPMTRGGAAVDFICFDRAINSEGTINPTTFDFHVPEGEQLVQMDNVYLYNDGSDGIVQLGFDTDWTENNLGSPKLARTTPRKSWCPASTRPMAAPAG